MPTITIPNGVRSTTPTSVNGEVVFPRHPNPTFEAGDSTITTGDTTTNTTNLPSETDGVLTLEVTDAEYDLLLSGSRIDIDDQDGQWTGLRITIRDSGIELLGREVAELLGESQPDLISTSLCVKKNIKIVRGDSYGGQGPSHQALEFKAEGISDGTAVIMTARDCDDEIAFQAAGTITSEVASIVFAGDVTSTVETEFRLKFDVEAASETNRKTIASGLIQLVEDQTR